MCTVQERAILDEAEEWENEELKEAVGIHCGDLVAAHYTSVGQCVYMCFNIGVLVTDMVAFIKPLLQNGDLFHKNKRLQWLQPSVVFVLYVLHNNNRK